MLTRRSELVALTTNDLETLADGTMRVIIRRSKADPFGHLTSASPKTPVRLAFPLDYRERLFPNLFADGDLPQ